MSGRADERGQVVFVLGRARCDRPTPNEIGSNSVDAVKIGLNVVLVLSGLLLTLLVLLHKGKGGGSAKADRALFSPRCGAQRAQKVPAIR